MKVLACQYILSVRLPYRGGRKITRTNRPCGHPAVVRHCYYADDLIVETRDYCDGHRGGDLQRETLAQRVARLDL